MPTDVRMPVRDATRAPLAIFALCLLMTVITVLVVRIEARSLDTEVSRTISDYTFARI